MREDLSLNAFTDIDHVARLETYVEALEAFDGIAQLQELKQIARSQVRPGMAVLDGCGFGLETQQLARRAGPARPACGISRRPGAVPPRPGLPSNTR